MHEVLNSRINFWLALSFVFLGTLAGAWVGFREAPAPVHDYTVLIDSGEAQSMELTYGVWPALTRTDFFEEVRERFVRENASFVEANLTAMQLTVYKNGTPIAKVPIASKGKEGSWWETPAGLYRAEAKKDKHFSSFGNVYTPWNIPFQGNFFIHGWPYYEDGTPVPQGYSGGCIRLDDVSAKLVYDLVEVGMPILVFEEGDNASDAFTYALKPPQVRAQGYLVADLETNFALLAGGIDSARTTSLVPLLMTALVASEYQNIEKKIIVDSTLASSMPLYRLVPGSAYSLYDLFFPLLMEGSNEARAAITATFGEERLGELLHAKARALGMDHTRFEMGEHFGAVATTTAEDVFTLLKYLKRNRPFLLAISAGKVDTRTYGEPAFADLVVRHPLDDMTSFRGGAIEESLEHYARTQENSAALMLAFTQNKKSAGSPAGSDLITVLSLSFNGSDRDIAFIVFDSPDPSMDTRALQAYTRWLFE